MEAAGLKAHLCLGMEEKDLGLHNRGLNLLRALAWTGLFHPSKESALCNFLILGLSQHSLSSRTSSLLLPGGGNVLNQAISVKQREDFEISPLPIFQGSRMGCLQKVSRNLYSTR